VKGNAKNRTSALRLDGDDSVRVEFNAICISLRLHNWES